ncbi:MAG: DUF1493 family protein [Bacteroidia bacterium]|jgi:hypothetical protein
MEVNEIEFTKLRHAYIMFKKFLESESLEKVKSLETSVEGDLGLVGDDNYELLTKFVMRFELNHGDFDYDKHFLSEGELFNAEIALLNLSTLSVRLPLKTIELLTLNNLKLNKPNFHKANRDVSDLTFKDLLTWYIEKEYQSRDSLKYKIRFTQNT